MLSEADNALLTQVGPNTSMGATLRRYWTPVCLAEEVAGLNCDPVRVTILGERVAVFRDDKGIVGVLRDRCPHRGASLALGRNEAGGLRCLYHGWKFDAAGACIEMPSEPSDTTFPSKLRSSGYPTRETGDLIWAYLGPAEHEPPFPKYDWMTAPSNQRAIVKIGQRANYLQALEGSIDSSHSWFLHRGSVFDWAKRSAISTDMAPRLEIDDTDYGFRYAAIRNTDADASSQYVRITIWAFPFFSMIPRPLESNLPYFTAVFVPVDDRRTMLYGIFCAQDGSNISTEEWRRQYHAVPGEQLDHEWFRIAQDSNKYLQDREAMRNGDWTGIGGFMHQDAAVSESMGEIADRSDEHLGSSDRAITRVRRRLLDCTKLVGSGSPAIGTEAGIEHHRLRALQFVIGKGVPWQTVDEAALA